MPNIITTSYVDPDLDGVACAIAYAELLNATGQSATACLMGQPTVEAEFVLTKLEIPNPIKRAGFEPHEALILLDASEPIHFEHHLSLEQVIEVIDHRKVNEAAKFTNAKIQIELVGAAATLVAEKFYQQTVTPSTKSAQLLQAAIISNTQNFQARTTTDRDHTIMKWLASIAPLPANFTHDMFAAKSDFTDEKLATAMDIETGIFAIAGQRLGVVQLEMVGSEALVLYRQNEIFNILDQLQTQNNLDLVFLSILDIEAKHNHFITADPQTQTILHSALDITFENNHALRQGIIMRKEIVPLVKAVMENCK